MDSPELTEDERMDAFEGCLLSSHTPTLTEAILILVKVLSQPSMSTPMEFFWSFPTMFTSTMSRLTSRYWLLFLYGYQP